MITIYAIPGLGTTAELFSFLKLGNYKLIVLNWPDTLPGISLKDYAQLFIKQINSAEPFILMGVSFGGMICSELSHLVPAQKTILISSCKNKNEFPFLLKALKYIPIHKLFSEKKLRQMAVHSEWILGFKKDYEDEFEVMIKQMKENYFKHSINMIINWKQASLPKNYIHIHGKKDRLLLYKNVTADKTIATGTHAMIVYQAEEISTIINELKL